MKEKIQGYNRTISEITPKRSDGELYNAVIGKAENAMDKRRINKKAIIIPVAAVLSCALAVGVGAAVMNYEHLTKLFGGNQTLTSEIQTNIFEDSDGHVKVSIDQFLSDGRYIFAGVHYQALDDKGKEWLDGVDFTSQDLCIGCDMQYPENEVRSIPYEITSYTNREIKEQRTENDRYYCLTAEIYSAIWDTVDSGIFYYSLPHLNKSAKLDISSTLEFKTYRIVGDGRSSKYLTPARLEISALSYALYAEDDYGITKIEYPEDGGWSESRTISDEEFEKEVLFIEKYLVMSDGEEIALWDQKGGSREDGTYLWSTGELFDCESESFYNRGEKNYNIEFDFSELKGIKINGVYYDLIEE